MLMILLPCLAQCLSMREAALHFITSIEKDGNSSSTLSLFLNACTYMPSTIDATFVYTSQPITWLLGGEPSFVFVFNKCRFTITLRSPHWYILAMSYAYWKMMEVAALFYLRYVVYDLTICSQLNGIKMIKYRLFYVALWFKSTDDLTPCVI